MAPEDSPGCCSVTTLPAAEQTPDLPTPPIVVPPPTPASQAEPAPQD